MFNVTCKNCQTALDSATYVGRGFCSEACRTVFQTPAVGKPATYNIGSDYYPYTIVKVSKTGFKLTVLQDNVRFPGVFEPGTGKVEYAYRTDSGTYRMGRCGHLYIGEREFKMDPSF